MFENVKCKYRIESPCRGCSKRKEACWDRCEKYISYKAETRKQKEFLCKAINWPAEGYEAEKRRAKARRNKQIGKS